MSSQDGSPLENATDAVSQGAESVAQHPLVTGGARLGYAVSGILHLIMGVLAVQLALGDRAADPDQSGALSALAGTPAGWLLLGAIALGLTLLGLWQAVQVVRRHPVGGRAKALGKAVLYGAMAATAIGFIRGNPTKSTRQTQDITALLMSWPVGVVLVALVGVAVLGVGVFHIVKGLRGSFRDDLVETPPAPIGWLAVAGYVAKGVALAVVGLLFLRAAMTHDPTGSTGLDGALVTLLAAPAGPALVAAVGLGFAAYGGYAFARARYART